MNRVITPFVTKRLTSTAQSDSYESFTPWMPAMGLDECKALLVGQQLIGTMRSRFAVQTAKARVQSPSAWAALDGSDRTDTFEACTGEQSLTSALSSAMWARFGMRYKLGTTGTYTQMETSVQTSCVSRGMMIGEMPEMTMSSADWTTWQTAWTTRWIPAAWVESVKAGVWLGDVVNTPEVRLAYQTAAVRPSNPDAWAACMPGGGPSSWTSADDYNTANVSVAITSKMWVRFGVQFKSVDAPAAGTLDQVTVGAVVGVRRS